MLLGDDVRRRSHPVVQLRHVVGIGSFLGNAEIPPLPSDSTKHSPNIAVHSPSATVHGRPKEELLDAFRGPIANAVVSHRTLSQGQWGLIIPWSQV
jgi:hypothetical protein